MCHPWDVLIIMVFLGFVLFTGSYHSVVHISSSLCLSVCFCLCRVCVYVCVCAHAHAHTYTCGVFACVCVCLCVSIFMCVLCLCLCMHSCMFVYFFLFHVCTYIAEPSETRATKTVGLLQCQLMQSHQIQILLICYHNIMAVVEIMVRHRSVSVQFLSAK